MTVEDVSWDLSPLVHGEGDAGADRLARRGRAARAGLRRHLRRPPRRARPRAEFAAAVDRAAGASPSSPRARATTRCCASASTPPTRRSARSCSACRRRARRSRRSCCSSSSSGRRSTTSAPTSCMAADGLDTARHFLRSARRYRPHLLSEPEEKILAEKSDLRQLGLGAAVQRAGLGAARSTLPDEDEPVTLDGALARLMSPDRDVRRATAEAVTDALEPGPAHARLHLQHAAARQGRRRPPAPLRQLAGRAQPLQRGLRRVRPGAAERRAQPLRDPAPLVSPQGAAARHRPARRLRPHGGRHAGRRARRVGGRQGARARLLRGLHARARRPGARVLRRQPHRRPAAAGQARRRVRRLHRARPSIPT